MFAGEIALPDARTQSPSLAAGAPAPPKLPPGLQVAPAGRKLMVQNSRLIGLPEPIDLNRYPKK